MNSLPESLKSEACIDLGSPTIEPCIQMIFQTADKADSAFQKAAVPTWFGKTRNNDLISLDGEPMNFQSSCHEHHEQRLRMIKIFAKDDLLLRMHSFFFRCKDHS